MTQKRIAVLGAGLSGLAAATQLVHGGHDVVVYEARNRPGGRVWSETMTAAGAEHSVERGAEFVLKGYSTFRQYCADFGLQLVNTGMSYYIRTPADRPGVTTEGMAALGRAAADAAAMGSGPRSVADVLDRLGIRGDTRDALVARIEISTAVRIDQVTAEKTLEHIASLEPGPSWRVGGGNQCLPNAMAARLGDRVRLGARVDTVLQTEERVLVTSGSQTEKFDYVVVALPFAVLQDPTAITIDLPEWKQEAMDRVVQGHAAKLHLALESTPDSSAVMSVDDRFWTWTANEEGGHVAPVLNCFGGELGHLKKLGIENEARVWEERVRTLRNDLSIAETGALVTAWPLDPLSGGAYTSHAPGFSDADARALESPHGRLFFAGEYIDGDFVGLMEGALRSGDHAADAIQRAGHGLAARASGSPR